MAKPEVVTMNDITIGSLFVLPSVGPLRKTGNCTATRKDGKEHVIYPNERVTLMTKRGGK